jgi:hypothetical protein
MGEATTTSHGAHVARSLDAAGRRQRDARVNVWMELFQSASQVDAFRAPAPERRAFDFDFRAPDEARARALATWFRTHTAYDVVVEHQKRTAPPLAGQRDTELFGWRVGGRTPPLNPAPPVFEQWLTFVVGVGLALDCELEACSGIDLTRVG